MNHKFKIFYFIFSVLFFYNCKSTVTVAEITALNNVISKKSFEITANSATPISFANTRGIENILPPGSNAAIVNLASIQNFIKIKNDSLLLNLPYYGELQIVSGYNSEAGLKFEGIPSESNISFNEKKNNYLIRYKVKAKNESLQIVITMFASKRCSFSINSSNRTTISYDGYWKEIE